MSSRGINKAILIGNLGQDPEIRALPSGDSVANISVATSESWKDKTTGEPVEKTEWHRVVFFGRLAEVVGQYLHKGSKVYIEGRLQTRKWQGNDGQDRYTTEVVVDQRGTMQMLDSRRDAGDGHQETSQATSPVASATPQRQEYLKGQQQKHTSNVPSNGFDEDIPF